MTQSTALKIVSSQQWTPKLNSLGAQLKEQMRRDAESTFVKGELLIEAQLECVRAGYGWYAWLESEGAMSIRSAQALMRVARELKAYRNSFSRLPASALNTLAQDTTPQPAITEVVSQLDNGHTLTLADVAEIISKHRATEMIALGGAAVLSHVELPAKHEKRVQAFVDTANEAMETGTMTVDDSVIMAVGSAVDYVAKVNAGTRQKIALESKSGNKYETTVALVENLGQDGVYVLLRLEPGDYLIGEGEKYLLIEPRQQT